MSRPIGERHVDTYGRRIAQAQALSILLSTGEAWDALQEFPREVYVNVAWLLEQTITEAVEAMEAHLKEQHAAKSAIGDHS